MSHKNISEKIWGSQLCLILSVSVARACMLFWCIEAGHHFLRLFHKMIFYQSKLGKDITHVDTIFYYCCHDWAACKLKDND